MMVVHHARPLQLDAALLRLEVEQIDWVIRRAGVLGSTDSLKVSRSRCSGRVGKTYESTLQAEQVISSKRYFCGNQIQHCCILHYSRASPGRCARDRPLSPKKSISVHLAFPLQSSIPTPCIGQLSLVWLSTGVFPWLNCLHHT